MTNPHFQIGLSNHAQPKTVVIAGVPRGGTSMVAGTVREMGINLGDRLGINHEDPAFLPQDVERIRELVNQRNQEQETWGWKMPHSLDYLDRIEDDLRNPHIILVWRNVAAIAISQVNWSGAELDTALAFSAKRLHHMSEKASLLKSPVLHVNYEQAVREPAQFVETLAAFLGIELDADKRSACLNFIDPDAGYKQVSFTYYEVEEIPVSEGGQRIELSPVNRDLKLDSAGTAYLKNGPRPIFGLRRTPETAIPDDFVVYFENCSNRAASVQIMFDFDWVFSENLAHNVTVEPGEHAFRVVNNGQLKKVGLAPSFTGGTSDIRGFEIRFTADPKNGPSADTPAKQVDNV